MFALTNETTPAQIRGYISYLYRYRSLLYPVEKYINSPFENLKIRSNIHIQLMNITETIGIKFLEQSFLDGTMAHLNYKKIDPFTYKSMTKLLLEKGEIHPKIMEIYENDYQEETEYMANTMLEASELNDPYKLEEISYFDMIISAVLYYVAVGVIASIEIKDMNNSKNLFAKNI